jgi:glycosidase
MLGSKGRLPECKEAQAGYVLDDVQRKRARCLIKLAAVLQYSLPGVPCLYYGDEAGLEGAYDPFNRRCFPWGKEEKSLTAFYRKLGNIRREHAAFAGGMIEFIEARDGLAAYRRKKGDSSIVVAVNSSQMQREVHLDEEYIDLWSSLPLSGDIAIQPWSFLIAEKDKV